jgi:hypothetical protein
MYSSLLVLVLKVLKERSEKEVGKKRLVLTSFDFEFGTTMHWPFLTASRVVLKVFSSILRV